MLSDPILRLTPGATAKTELHQMEQALDAVGKQLQKMHRQLAAEECAHDTILARFDIMEGAAARLKQQIESETNLTKKAGLTASLVTLTGQIDAIAPELDEEKHDLDATRSLLADVEAAYQQKATELTGARQELQQAKQRQRDQS